MTIMRNLSWSQIVSCGRENWPKDFFSAEYRALKAAQDFAEASYYAQFENSQDMARIYLNSASYNAPESVRPYLKAPPGLPVAEQTAFCAKRLAAVAHCYHPHAGLQPDARLNMLFATALVPIEPGN
jgi:hypothetical protein